MDYETVKVRPNQLRFTQDSIADHFKLDHGKKFLLMHALSDLRSNRLHASNFPLINVAKDEDGVLWSNDNRRLWLFRKAPVSIIKVNLYSSPLFRAPPEPHLREQMGREDYFPRVRWRNKRPARTRRNPPSKVEQESKEAAPYSFVSEKHHEPRMVFSCQEELRSEQERRAPPVSSPREEARSQQESWAPPISSRRSEQEKWAPPVSSRREEVRSEQERRAPPVSSRQEDVRSEQERRAPPVSSPREEARSQQERWAPPISSRRSKQEKCAPPVSSRREEVRSEQERRAPPVSSRQEDVRSEQERRAPPVSSRREEARSQQERRAPPDSSHQENERSDPGRPGTSSKTFGFEVVFVAAAAAAATIWVGRKMFGVRRN